MNEQTVLVKNINTSDLEIHRIDKEQFIIALSYNGPNFLFLIDLYEFSDIKDPLVFVSRDKALNFIKNL